MNLITSMALLEPQQSLLLQGQNEFFHDLNGKGIIIYLVFIFCGDAANSFIDFFTLR